MAFCRLAKQEFPEFASILEKFDNKLPVSDADLEVAAKIVTVIAAYKTAGHWHPFYLSKVKKR